MTTNDTLKAWGESINRILELWAPRGSAGAGPSSSSAPVREYNLGAPGAFGPPVRMTAREIPEAVPPGPAPQGGKSLSQLRTDAYFRGTRGLVGY